MRFRFCCILILAVLLLASASAFGQNADLFVAKNGPSTAAAGTDVSYDISIGNAGPDDAIAAAVDDPIQNFFGSPGMTAPMTFVSITQNSGPMFTCTTPMVGTSGDVNCSIATFTSGSSADFTLTVHIPPATPQGTTFTNMATVSSMTPDPNPENDSSTAATTVPIPSADLTVTKNGPLTAGPGSNVSYDIQITNGGPNDATTVSLTDTLPGTMTFVSFMQNSGPTFSCTTGTTTTCTIGTLTAGSSADFTLVGNIPMGTANGTSFQNTATGSSATADPDPGNNSGVTGLTVATADVSITKTAPPTVLAGNTVAYNITVTDNGPNDAQTPQFTDALPAGLTFVSIVQNTGTLWNCTTPSVGANGTVSCGGGALTNGTSATFTITARVPAGTANGTMITNTANVSAATADPTPANNSSSASTTVSTQADLSVVKTGPNAVQAGNNISYTITVSNAGPSNAATVSLVDTIPAGTSFVSVTPAAGWNCSGTTTVTCTIASFGLGTPAVFTLVVSTPPALSATVTNTATVSSATTDPTPGNNTSSASTIVTAVLADVAITKTNNAIIGAVPGTNVTYTITVTNNGPTSAANVTVNDPLPANVTLVMQTPSQGSCVGSTCTLGTIANGASATISVVVTAGPVFGPVTNTATVSTSNVDPNPANNTASSTFVVVPTIPAAGPTALMLLGMALAVAGMLLIRRGA